jgi:mRNA-decapping enzyme 1B
MDESAKLRMNLVAIQKVDPYAKEIIDSCPHVAFYKYINDEWEKSEIEGNQFLFFFIYRVQIYLR